MYQINYCFLLLSFLFFIFTCQKDLTSSKDENKAPVSSFTVLPSSGDTSTIFKFNASGCSDNEDSASTLQVRWDWENDGNWDTQYSINKTSTHQYSIEGTKTINLEVIDMGSLSTSTTNEISVTGTVIDIDSNIYQTIEIGNQWWMTENLKVTHYNNGETIPNITNNNTWPSQSTGVYCEYANDINNVELYGRLYNWLAVNDNRNIAPIGWHIPSDEEWKQLEINLGMSQVQSDSTGWRGKYIGGKLKEIGTIHWISPNSGATDESGFKALPGGYRFINGSFNDIGFNTTFWSTTGDNGVGVWVRVLHYDKSKIFRNYDDQRNGFSVRCIRD